MAGGIEQAERLGRAAPLDGEGPFTVFAPDDAGFEALPAGTVGTLLKPEGKETFMHVLTYHVVPAG